MVDIEITVMVGVNDIRVVVRDFRFDSLNDIKQGGGVETIVWEAIQADSCAECLSRLLGSLSTLFDLIIGGLCIIVARGNSIREDANVDIFSIDCMPGERTADAEYLVIGMCNDTEYGHSCHHSSNSIEHADSSLLYSHVSLKRPDGYRLSRRERCWNADLRVALR
jgi:hypothetical protein